VEGYSESLDHELRAAGIRVVLVEPGVTRTAFDDNLSRPDRPLPLHDAERARMEALMRGWIAEGDAPEVVAAAVLKAASARVPKLRYAAGRQARQVSWLRRFLPEAMVDRSLRKFNGLPV
jgi:short-subunit dehydrogenase